MGITHILSTEGFVVVNKQMIKKLGLSEATIFGVLCSEYNYWEANNKLHYGMFYCTIEKLEESTGLSYYKQNKAILNLEKSGLINVVLEGMPATRYFKINEEAVFEFFGISFQKTSKLDLEKFETSNNIYNKKENNNSSKDEEKPHTNDELDRLKKLIEKEATPLDQKFLGSLPRPKKTPTTVGKNRFQQCVDVIDEYIDKNDQVAVDLLIQYLKMLFEDKDKQIYVNQWRGLLNKLNNVVASGNNIHDVIRQSIEHGYKSFYPINQKFKAENPKNHPDKYGTDQRFIDEVNTINNSKDDSQKIDTTKIY